MLSDVQDVRYQNAVTHIEFIIGQCFTVQETTLSDKTLVLPNNLSIHVHNPLWHHSWTTLSFVLAVYKNCRECLPTYIIICIHTLVCNMEKISYCNISKVSVPGTRFGPMTSCLQVRSCTNWATRAVDTEHGKLVFWQASSLKTSQFVF